jgi:ABC-2 type transport system ATP-binding protein
LSDVSSDVSSDVAISVRELTKTFGQVRALDGLDLEVRTGEVHGFLGPNGAGKSTTIRVLLGLLRADGGRARLLDGDPWADAVRLHRRLAYVPGDVDLWPSLTGGEALDLITRLHGGAAATAGAAAATAAEAGRDRRTELLSRFELDPTRRIRTYSTGNRRKVVLVAALLSALSGNAELVLLDEPTAGLDPLMEEIFREYVGELRELGRTVLLSSHTLSEVEALADRVTIIRRGRSVETGTMAELRHLTRTSVVAELERPADLPSDFAGQPGVHDLLLTGATLRCQVEPAALDATLAALARAGVAALEVRPPTLEELFLRHYAEQEPEPRPELAPEPEPAGPPR